MVATVVDLASARERHRVRQEARAWLRRLSVKSITTDELREYFRWVQQPGHREAYAKADRETPDLWRR